jgi:hypothetical protein
MIGLIEKAVRDDITAASRRRLRCCQNLRYASINLSGSSDQKHALDEFANLVDPQNFNYHTQMPKMLPKWCAPAAHLFL